MSNTAGIKAVLEKGPISRFYDSYGLKLHFWDYGQDNKPPVILVHGGRDHARSWDWVAASLREDYHVYALDLRGHGDSGWVPGGMYTIAQYVLDLSTFCKMIIGTPLALIGHSLGGIVALTCAGLFNGRVCRVVTIEGVGPTDSHPVQKKSFPGRMSDWMDNMSQLEQSPQRRYPDLESAEVRMREVNPRLSTELARHLTIHGMNINSDGSFGWKFDPFVRAWPPYGFSAAESSQVYEKIECPVLILNGTDSLQEDPEKNDHVRSIKNHRTVSVPSAGHWVHHDQLEVFLNETVSFLAE
jgi:pimeloyl-ACP methyl ester carboxylesterase